MRFQLLSRTIAALALAALCAVPVASTYFIERSQSVEPFPIGAKLPPFNARYRDGRPFVRDTVNAKKLLLICFSAYCSHCKTEIENFCLLHKKYRDQLDFAAFSVDPPASNEASSNDLHATLPLICADGRDLLILLKIVIVPSVLCLDERQVVRWRSTGEHSLQDDEKLVERFLGGDPP